MHFWHFDNRTLGSIYLHNQTKRSVIEVFCSVIEANRTTSITEQFTSITEQICTSITEHGEMFGFRGTKFSIISLHY